MTDRPSTQAIQQCRECKRRKGKCDGKLPVCSICQRYKRHCLYDKHSRSPLTRKHLTEVEEQLEIAKALLRTRFGDAQLNQMLAHGGSDGQAVTENLPVASDDVPRTFDASSQSPVTPANNAPNDSAPFENLPAADDDFEWDEREHSSSSINPDGHSADLTQEPDLDRITDGMATLTADDSNTGFLGSVSGAALLRLIWMGNNDTEGTGDKLDTRNERRDGLERVFADRPEVRLSSSLSLQSQPQVTRLVADTLVDAHFKLYHTAFPILHEPSFREQYSKLDGRPGTTTFHILARLVAVLGAFVSGTGTDEFHATLFNTVKADLNIGSLETGNLGLVQAFALAANYLQKRNRPNSGYIYGGIAVRLAVSLGLHKDFHGRHATPFKQEVRRRVWWSLCVLDVGATVTYGRPLNWPQVGVETAFPRNIHEKNLEPMSPSFPPELHEVTVYTYLRTQSLYHLRTMRIYNRLISSPLPSAAEVISLDDEHIEGWRKSLPPYWNDRDLPLEYLLGHYISRLRFRLLRIIMYRPFLIRWAQNGFSSIRTEDSATERIAITRCFAAATESISCVYYFWSTGRHTRLAAWYTLYFLLQAALIPIHCLRRNPSHPEAPSWREQVVTSLNIIDAMTALNPSATKCRDIIQRLCGESLHLHQSYGQGRDQPQPVPVISLNYPTEEDFANANDFDFSALEYSHAGINPWDIEVDAAVDGYNNYVQSLSNNVAMAGTGTASVNQNAGTASTTMYNTDDKETGTGVPDWEWGLSHGT
ncbi:transcriptional regulatory protein GAL4 [Exophiala viscosa]|uniref:Transcriptional regulatory protein GAL4 n=1 Tax=Exophiala viscosa TaxID=2486360 RepID=A0AAN6IDK0_9EURO|nr:transcriptional regulatory protein GAL4 [Exophiala viscosa]